MALSYSSTTPPPPTAEMALPIWMNELGMLTNGGSVGRICEPLIWNPWVMIVTSLNGAPRLTGAVWKAPECSATWPSVKVTLMPQ